MAQQLYGKPKIAPVAQGRAAMTDLKTPLLTPLEIQLLHALQRALPALQFCAEGETGEPVNAHIAALDAIAKVREKAGKE
jgi:hypothetical protein